MDEQAFRVFLTGGGRSPSATDRVVGYVGEFETYLHDAGTTIDDARPGEVESFVSHLESTVGDSAKLHLWAIHYWFEFVDDPVLAHLAADLRRQRVEEAPFRIRGFRGVDLDHVAVLEKAGLGSAPVLLEAAATPSSRLAVSDRHRVPLEVVEELARLCDLARIRGIKGIRARLYLDAGVGSVPDLSRWVPERLHAHLLAWVASTGFEGIPPRPGEVTHAVGSARRLERAVEW